MAHRGLPDATESVSFRFQEEKATDAATHLLRLHGGSMTRLTLLKLLYFGEREAAARHNRPICGGHYVSMPHGPVLSEVYDLMKDERPSQVWAERIESHGQNVTLVDDQMPSAVSKAELDVLDAIYAQWGGRSASELRRCSHELVEWKDPNGSSLPIEHVEFLRAIRKSEQEIQDIADEVRVEDHYHQILRQ